METATVSEVTELQREIKQLQADLSTAVEKWKESNLLNGHSSTFASAQKMWTDIKQQAEQVGHEIEERPMVSALTAFGTGVVLGMLLRGGRS